jgi:hypothetical protein
VLLIEDKKEKSMSTKIVGSRYDNSPNEDVFVLFDKDKDGFVLKTKEAAIERAKIAAKKGFLVDPISGAGYWSLGNWRDLSVTMPKIRR